MTGAGQGKEGNVMVRWGVGAVLRLREAAGKRITSIKLAEAGDTDGLFLAFDDDSGICIRDDEQMCCEDRYMTTDDTLQDFVGALFKGAEVRDAPGCAQADEYDHVHEVQFLVVQTSLGDFTIETHNEHNGYYGGFAITVNDWVPPECAGAG